MAREREKNDCVLPVLFNNLTSGFSPIVAYFVHIDSINSANMAI